MTCGIYKLTFADNSFYVGQSQNIERRFKQHLALLQNNTACNKKLAYAYANNGNPVLSILQECNIKELDSIERHWISKLNATKDGLNILIGGTGFLEGSDNSNSKYSTELIEKAFFLIVENSNTLADISEITGINYHVIGDIANGRYYLWLSEKYSEQYKNMLDLRGKRIASNGKNSKTAAELGIQYPRLKSPDGTIYTVENASKFARDHKLGSGTLFDLLKGRKTFHRGWEVC